jgi:glycine cleavage system aminomethyltransferase T
MERGTPMLKTYAAARSGVALFDNQKEGRFRLSGPSYAALNELVSVDLDLLDPFAGVVGLVTQPDAQLVAIVLIFRGDDEFYLFTEHDRADALHQYLVERLAESDVLIEDLRYTHDWLAIVGPLAQDVMVEAGGEDILGLPYLSYEDNGRLGCQLFRVGFTGEFEYRFLVPRAHADELRSELDRAGAASGMILGDVNALPVLFLEVRFPVHGDIGFADNILEAGLHWMVNFRKPNLVGGKILHKQKRSLKRRGLMLRLDGAGKAKGGDQLLIEGQEVGVMARVANSPTLGGDIGLAYVNADVGWVGVSFDVVGAGGSTVGQGISAPTVLTRSVYTS